MIVGVDFDRVLFDTDSFNEEMKESAGLYHVDADVYDDEGNYSPEKHAEACGVDPEKIYEFIEKGVERFLFDDVDVLQDVEHEVWLVTRGERRFQKTKIDNSGIERYVDEVRIVENGDKDIGIDFLIDDRGEEIRKAEVPGYVLDRTDGSLKDAIEAMDNHEA